jgi:hypothetical protein
MRSFGVVGALAAAALALVIGVFLFNSHHKESQAQPGGGPTTGHADHPVAHQESLLDRIEALVDFRDRQPVEASRPNQPPPSSNQGLSGARNSVVFGNSSGGGSTPTPAPVRSCSPGLIGGLLNVLGGLLGGGGGNC